MNALDLWNSLKIRLSFAHIQIRIEKIILKIGLKFSIFISNQDSKKKKFPATFYSIFLKITKKALLFLLLPFLFLLLFTERQTVLSSSKGQVMLRLNGLYEGWRLGLSGGVVFKKERKKERGRVNCVLGW